MTMDNPRDKDIDFVSSFWDELVAMFPDEAQCLVSTEPPKTGLDEFGPYYQSINMEDPQVDILRRKAVRIQELWQALVWGPPDEQLTPQVACLARRLQRDAGNYMATHSVNLPQVMTGDEYIERITRTYLSNDLGRRSGGIVLQQADHAHW
jgi:hypothetical protein